MIFTSLDQLLENAAGGVCKVKYACNPVNFIRISIFAITKEAEINRQSELKSNGYGYKDATYVH